MAKLKGYFEEFLDWLHSDITHGRVSASHEDGSDTTIGMLKVAVRVYERFGLTEVIG